MENYCKYEGYDEPMQSYDIGFVNAEGKKDETQFDIPAAKRGVEAFRDLMELFCDFCEENRCDPLDLLYIRNAPGAE